MAVQGVHLLRLLHPHPLTQQRVQQKLHPHQHQLDSRSAHVLPHPAENTQSQHLLLAQSDDRHRRLHLQLHHHAPLVHGFRLTLFNQVHLSRLYNGTQCIS